MKKPLVISGAFTFIYTLVLIVAFKSFQTDLELSAVGLSWEKDTTEIVQRMQQVGDTTKTKIIEAMSFPVASYSIHKAGGELPLWGAIGQGTLYGLILFFFIRPKGNNKAQ